MVTLELIHAQSPDCPVEMYLLVLGFWRKYGCKASIGGGAWPFLVGGMNCPVHSVN